MLLLMILMALSLARFERLLDRARRGRPSAWRGLVDAFLPVIRARICREIGRARGVGAPLRHMLHMQEDLEQQVFLFLFKDDARALQDYDAERGLSLENYVGMIAQREATNAARYWRAKSRRGETLWEDEAPEGASPVDEVRPDAETSLAERQQLERIWKQLEDTLTPKGLVFFRLLFVEELAVEQVAETLGCTKRSVYNWKNKLKQTAKQLRADWSHP